MHWFELYLTLKGLLSIYDMLEGAKEGTRSLKLPHIQGMRPSHSPDLWCADWWWGWTGAFAPLTPGHWLAERGSPAPLTPGHWLAERGVTCSTYTWTLIGWEGGHLLHLHLDTDWLRVGSPAPLTPGHWLAERGSPAPLTPGHWLAESGSPAPLTPGHWLAEMGSLDLNNPLWNPSVHPPRHWRPPSAPILRSLYIYVQGGGLGVPSVETCCIVTFASNSTSEISQMCYKHGFYLSCVMLMHNIIRAHFEILLFWFVFSLTILCERVQVYGRKCRAQSIVTWTRFGLVTIRSTSSCILFKSNLNGQIMYFYHSNNIIKSNEGIDFTRSRSKIL